MIEFLQFMFLWVFSGKKGRQELNRTLAWQHEQYRRMNEDNRRFVAAMDEIMADSTADLLANHRRHRTTRALQTR